MSNIQEFCGLPSNESFEIYVTNDGSTFLTFGRCFLWSAISTTTHLIVAVIASFFLGTSRTLGHAVKRSPIFVVTAAIALVMVLSIITEMILSYTLHEAQNHPPAYVLAKAVSFTSWLLCLILLWRWKILTGRSRSQIRLLTVAYLLVLVSSGLQFQFVAQNKKLKPDALSSISVIDVGVLIDFSCTGLFFLVCVWLSSSKVVVSASYDEMDEKEDEKKKEKIHLGKAEATRNIISRLVFWWTNKLLQKGIKGQLNEPDDLFVLPKDLETDTIRKLAFANLKAAKDKVLIVNDADQSIEPPKPKLSVPLLSILNKSFGKVFYSIGIFKLFYVILELVQPLLVNLLVNYVAHPEEPLINGVYYACAFLITSLLSVLFDQHYRYNMKKSNLRVRAALVTMIYEKTLSVRSSSINDFSSGNVVNLMSSDADQVRRFCDNFHECWGTPFQLIVCFYLLYQQVGIAFISPIVYIILTIPLSQRLSKKILDKEKEVLTERDKRVKMLSEVLFGIRIIKYNVWEKHFTEAVSIIRRREIGHTFVLRLIVCVVIVIWSMSVSVMLLLTFGTYIAFGNELSAAKVFTVMALINQFVNPLNNLSWNINAILNSWVSLKRIQSYLSLPEICKEEYYDQKDGKIGEDEDVNVRGGTFSWIAGEKGEGGEKVKENGEANILDEDMKRTEKETVKLFQLKNIFLQIEKGRFLGITGKVGSGKSSLFAAITAELLRNEGSVSLSRDLDANGIAFFPQEPWIQHMTIRDNILFGQDYDEQRYNEVVYACALIEDMALFSARDMTEVGEKGVNLSGGQKARIALARCVYQDKGMYLLDDPIAAVDAHVASHIYKHCIMGLLKDKTRVLSTHHTTYLQQAHHVLVFEDGDIVAQGLPGDVLKNIQQSIDLEEAGEGEKEETVKTKNGKDKNDEGEGKLVEEEEKRVGNVSFDVYKLYWKSVGSGIAIVTVAVMVLGQACLNVQDYWLAHWVNTLPTGNGSDIDVFYSSFSYWDLDDGATSDYGYYFSIYGYLAIGYLLCRSTDTVVFIAFGVTRAMTKLHDSLLRAVMKTPIAFFDANPVGRILNRFSSDMSEIDSEIGWFVHMFIESATLFVGQIVLICISMPWFTVFLVPLWLMYHWVQNRYRKSSRELKRIGSVSRSPIYEHFTETLSGCMTIRAFRETSRFVSTNESILDCSQRAEYNQEIAALWLAFRLNMIGVLSVTAVAIVAVMEHHFGSTNAGLVGLAITYSIQITPILSWLLNVFTEMEKQLVHVERVSQYINETPREIEKSTQIPAQWPQEGKICFNGVSLRYREDLPYALKEVCFEVKSGEKIGICGRTGSGKSTLLKVLFNIVDINGGSVLIDGINISEIDNSILRSRMSIIPQDPFLFDDSVAKNLDPAGLFPTHEMLDVLDKCHLRKVVENLGGLEGSVGEKGNNLSAGQKQLLCLARALLRKSPIICVDEATASVDLETDLLIQQTIREGFGSSTVLTIAHRLNTIMDSDQVFVMDAGTVMEMGSPRELLQETTSEFYALVHENKKSNAGS